jgi:hypothetical protein
VFPATPFPSYFFFDTKIMVGISQEKLAIKMRVANEVVCQTSLLIASRFLQQLVTRTKKRPTGFTVVICKIYSHSYRTEELPDSPCVLATKP